MHRQVPLYGSLQQPHESCLLEMVIRGQRLGQSALLHDDEAGAIHQAPFLVGTGFPELPGCRFQGQVNWYDLDRGISARASRSRICCILGMRSGRVSRAVSSSSTNPVVMRRPLLFHTSSKRVAARAWKSRVWSAHSAHPEVSTNRSIIAASLKLVMQRLAEIVIVPDRGIWHAGGPCPGPAS